MLLYTDTDSYIYEMETDDFYSDIVGDVETLFDTSEFDVSHPSGIQTGVNKKVICMMKDEAGGKIIQECVCLGAKQHSYITYEDSSEHKRCKGVKKNVVENGCSKWKKTLAYLLVLPGSRARIVRCGGRYDPQLVKRSSE